MSPKAEGHHGGADKMCALTCCACNLNVRTLYRLWTSRNSSAKAAAGSPTIKRTSVSPRPSERDLKTASGAVRGPFAAAGLSLAPNGLEFPGQPSIKAPPGKVLRREDADALTVPYFIHLVQCIDDVETGLQSFPAGEL